MAIDSVLDRSATGQIHTQISNRLYQISNTFEIGFLTHSESIARNNPNPTHRRSDHHRTRLWRSNRRKHKPLPTTVHSANLHSVPPTRRTVDSGEKQRTLTPDAWRKTLTASSIQAASNPDEDQASTYIRDSPIFNHRLLPLTPNRRRPKGTK